MSNLRQLSTDELIERRQMEGKRTFDLTRVVLNELLAQRQQQQQPLPPEPFQEPYQEPYQEPFGFEQEPSDDGMIDIPPLSPRPEPSPPPRSKKPRPPPGFRKQFRKQVQPISSIQEEADRLLRDPTKTIEFVLGQRRFKLIPVGTIEPVPKEIIRGERGRLYYWKKWDNHGNLLPPAKYTRVYLKKYQRDQCLTGESDRANGLAGWIGGVCQDQPEPRRMRAARPPRGQGVP